MLLKTFVVQKKCDFSFISKHGAVIDVIALSKLFSNDKFLQNTLLTASLIRTIEAIIKKPYSMKKVNTVAAKRILVKTVNNKHGKAIVLSATDESSLSSVF